jgi:hypothetical protein
MAAMTFQQFRCFIWSTIEIVSRDLDVLEGIANEVNNALSSSSTTAQTTKRPGDVNNCEHVLIDVSRCTIPIAMVCFSVIDMIGNWLNEKEEDDFSLAAGNYFSVILKNDDFKNNNSKQKIKEHFRNGIMHSFFSMKGFSVAYPPFDGNSLFIDLEGKSNTLDVRYLAKMVRKGFDNLMKIIDDSKSEISERLYSGFERWDSKK